MGRVLNGCPFLNGDDFKMHLKTSEIPSAAPHPQLQRHLPHSRKMCIPWRKSMKNSQHTLPSPLHDATGPFAHTSSPRAAETHRGRRSCCPFGFWSAHLMVLLNPRLVQARGYGKSQPREMPFFHRASISESRLEARELETFQLLSLLHKSQSTLLFGMQIIRHQLMMPSG